MATAEFAARVHDEDGVAVIELTGDVDRGAEAALDAAYGAGRARPVGRARLRGRRLHQLDRHRADRRAPGPRRARTDRTLSARGLTEHYREIFAITRLSDFMTILDEEEAE